MTLPISTSDIIKRWLAGDSVYKIARDLGCCEGTVRYRIHTRDFQMRRGNLDALTIERIRALHAQGVSRYSIAHELNVSPRSVVRYCNMTDYRATLEGLRDQLVGIRDGGKVKDTTTLEMQIEALSAILI